MVGGIIGALLGGFAGGMAGAKISIRVYERIEARMALHTAKARAKLGLDDEEHEEVKMDFGVTTYEDALLVLGCRDDDGFDFIFFEYQFLMQHL